jgi:hypothetical protein
MSQRKVVSTKKRVARKLPVKSPKKSLIHAEGGACFWIHDGPIICDLRDLEKALSTGKVSDAQWKHHVSTSHNHFAAWIQDVFRNKILADKFRKAKTKSLAAKVLNTSLKR